MACASWITAVAATTVGDSTRIFPAPPDRAWRILVGWLPCSTPNNQTEPIKPTCHEHARSRLSTSRLENGSPAEGGMYRPNSPQEQQYPQT